MRPLCCFVLSFIILSSCHEEKEKEISYIKAYYPKIYLAEEAFYKGEYQKTFDLISAAEDEYTLLDQNEINEMYLFAESAVHIGNHEKALEIIESMLKIGYDIEELKNNEVFKQLINLAGWKKLKINAQKFHNTYMSSIDLEVREKLKNMIKKDQEARSLLRNPNGNRDSIWNIISTVDSINDIQFKSIIEEVGYPNKKVIGDYRIDGEIINPEILLFHFEDYTYYTKTLKALIDEGQAPPKSLATFVDSYQRKSKDKKRFIYRIYDNVGGEEIIDYENLDTRREAIGLPAYDLKQKIKKLKKAYFKR